MPQGTERKKTARLEARLTPAIYALLQRAAEIQGRSVSEFVVSAAQEAAATTIERQELIRLTLADQERFAAALRKPRITPAMKRAAAAHRNLIERS